MSSARFNAESSSVETPLQQPSISLHPDAPRATHQNNERGGDGWRTLINYISGGQGGTGGSGLRGHGGGGGTGEGPTLQYDIKTEHFIIKNFASPETTPSDFLRIPLGNIDLRSEIEVNAATGVVRRHRERKRARRMYSARVVGHNEPMTVALYQGDNAEEEWKRDISHHSGLRHPHILQIYASASSPGIHATVFHDDLVLFSRFLDSYRDSVVLGAYILWSTISDFWNAHDYCERILPMKEKFRICWIRCSTGRLCME
ncbi:hypothetical protein C8R45DRAFT_1082084, partial [Mycena sanguinolenta]